MKIELVRNVELYQKGNTLIGYEKGGPLLNNTLSSVVIGNMNGGKKRAMFVNEGSKEHIFAGVPVTINDIIVYVTCDVDYNINIDVTRVTGINKTINGRIFATCTVIDKYRNESWICNVHDDYSDIIQAGLLRATSLKKTAVYVEEYQPRKKHA